MSVIFFALIVAVAFGVDAAKAAAAKGSKGGQCSDLKLGTQKECDEHRKAKGDEQVCGWTTNAECCKEFGLVCKDAKSNTAVCDSKAFVKSCKEATGAKAKSGCQEEDAQCKSCNLCTKTEEAVAATLLPEAIGNKVMIIAALSFVILAGIVAYARREKGDEYEAILDEDEEA